MSKLAEYVAEAALTGHRRTTIKEQLAAQTNVRSLRTIDNWINGTTYPTAHKAQKVAMWLSNCIGRKVTVEELWPNQSTN